MNKINNTPTEQIFHIKVCNVPKLNVNMFTLHIQQVKGQKPFLTIFQEKD
jgi:hypothetical protein